MKYLYLIILLILALLFSSLSSGKTNIEPDNTDTPAESSTVSDDSEDVDDCVEFIGSVYSYEEYIDFMASNPNLPKNFIAYEDGIDEIGEFDVLIIGSADNFIYEVTDENDVPLTIYFNRIDENVNLSNAVVLDDVVIGSSDLSMISPAVAQKLHKYKEVDPLYFDTAMYYYEDGIAYIYPEDNKCYSVIWETDNWKITVHGGNSFRLGNYPKNGAETFVSKLLNASTAKATVDSFNESIK